MKKEEAVATLISYRIEQAEKAIEDAHCLLSGNGSPQSIINRSYYAMFYVTLALMLQIGKSFSKHSGAISAIDVSFRDILRNVWIFPTKGVLYEIKTLELDNVLRSVAGLFWLGGFGG